MNEILIHITLICATGDVIKSSILAILFLYLAIKDVIDTHWD